MFFDRVTTKDGLSQSTITWILQDKNGFLWFATYDGLNRYDGYSFKIFRHDDANDASLRTNSLTYLHEDSQGYIWIINNRSEGLDRFNPSTEEFEHFMHDPDDTTSISNDEVLHVFEDSNGNIWVCTSNYLNLAIRSEADPNAIIGFEKIAFPNSDVYFSWAFENHKGELYACSDSLYRIDPINKKARNTGVRLESSAIQSVVEYQSKITYIGTNQNGIIKLEYDSIQGKYSRVDPGIVNITPNHRNVLYADHNNHIWIGTELEGLYRYQPELNKIDQYLPDDFEDRSISDKTIYSIFKDNTGILWVGTFSQGLNKYNFYRKRFIHFYRIPYYSNSLSGDLVSSIHGLNPDELWVGLDVGGGVNRILFSGNNEPEFIQYLPNKYNANSIKGESTLSLVQRKNGDVWIGSAGGYISRITPEKPFSGDEPKIKNYQMEKWTFSLYEDSDGILWGGTWGLGLWRFDDVKETFKLFMPDSTNEYSIHGNIIWSIGEDAHKNIWVGSKGNGIAVLTADEKRSDNPRFHKFEYTPSDSTSISDNTITAICQASDGTIWVTSSHGLNKSLNHNEITGTFDDFPHLEFKAYYSRDGLPSNGTVGVLEDNSGNIWVSTNNGISKLDVNKEEFTNYTENHGLQNNEFWHNAYFKDKNGVLFFGGVNGFNAFFPDKIEKNPFTPVVELTALKLFNKIVNVGDTIHDQVILSHPIHETDELVLSYQNNILTLEFAALHYEQPAQNQYTYYLENFEDGWNEITNKRTATYTNLDPGEYIFRVKASNGDQMWSDNEVALKIIVLPPWYKTIFFKAAFPVLVFIFILGIFFLRIRLLQRQKRLLEFNVSQRTHELVEKNKEIATQNEELQALSEELTSQNDQLELLNNAILKQKEHISEINENLELKVEERTDQLNRTIDELNKTIAELDRFVYSASHDLSAPLKSIKGILYLSKYDHITEDVEQKNRYIESSISKLEHVITSLTEFSRNSRLNLKYSDVNLRELLNDCYGHLKYLRPNYEVEFDLRVGKEVKIKTDELRFKIIANNLISNALKYQDDKKEYHYLKIRFAENNNNWILTFEDNGIGIPESQFLRVFDMFHRGTEKSNGSGLGLYIVKETLGKLKGEIELESIENIGTTFRIILPKNHHV